MKQYGLLLSVLAAIMMAGCTTIGRLDVGPTQTKTETVMREDATAVDVDINMGIGELIIDGGANDLLEAEFTYNVDEWEPIVSYDAGGSRGRLTINTPENTRIEGIPNDELRYNWDLNFSEDVPMNLDIDLGAGSSELDLSGLQLTGLNIDTGVGETIVDLSGDWSESFDANISGGIGKMTVILPTAVGVRIESSTGIGSSNIFGLRQNGNVYTNDAYGDSDVTIDLTISGGIGDITLRLDE